MSLSDRIPCRPESLEPSMSRAIIKSLRLAIILLPILPGCARNFIDVADPAVVLYKTGAGQSLNRTSTRDAQPVLRYLESWSGQAPRESAQEEEAILNESVAKGGGATPSLAVSDDSPTGDDRREFPTLAEGTERVQPGAEVDVPQSPADSADSADSAATDAVRTNGEVDPRVLSRNRAIYRHIRNISGYHEAYSMSLHLRIANGKTAFDFTNLGLTFAATITSSVDGSAILSGLATVLTGSELALETNFLQNQAVIAILQSMDSIRTDARAKIEARMTSDYDAYPMEAAEAELVRYFASSSLVLALQKLAQDASMSQQDAQERLEDVQDARTGVDENEIRKKLSDLVMKQGMKEELEDWIQANDLKERSGGSLVPKSAGVWIHDKETSPAMLRAAAADFALGGR